MDWREKAEQIKTEQPDRAFGETQLHRHLKQEGFMVSARTVGRWLKNYYEEIGEDKHAKIEKDFQQDKGTITAKSLNIQTLEQALEASEVDLNIWKVDRHVINSWEVTTGDGRCYTNYQVKVWLKRHSDEAPLQTALEGLCDELRTLKPDHPKSSPSGDHLLEIAIFDHHFGKLAWREETESDYDLKIARHLFLNAVARLLGRAEGFGFDKILFPLGNDFLNVNGPENATVAGTPQDVDGRYPKLFTVAKLAFIEAVQMCLEKAPVEVIWVGSNHDVTASYALAQVVDAYFHNTDAVSVKAGANPRKFVKHGKCLLGFTHGDDEKMADLPLIMATTCPEDWAQTTHREWHIGHYHKKKETRFVAGDTWNGVAVRILPSLSGTDAWHHRKGYCNNKRAAEAYLWHPEEGYAGHLSVNAEDL